jgi:flagellar protein FliS
MMNTAYQSAMKQYGHVGPLASAREQSPQQLVEMLIAGALQKIAQARQAQLAGDVPMRGRRTGEAVAVLGYLRGILDLKAGGEVATSLDALYGYCLQTLVQANLHDDAPRYAEVSDLLSEVKSAWDAMIRQQETGA